MTALRLLALLARTLGFACAGVLAARAQTYGTQPTVQDVDPGIDHGSSEEALDYQWRKQPVYFRSDYSPGTIVVFTADRYLYLVQSPTRAIRYAGDDRAAALFAALHGGWAR
jgi:lipoprotein-anchoring transpeptidase ErfK/SrfK